MTTYTARLKKKTEHSRALQVKKDVPLSHPLEVVIKPAQQDSFRLHGEQAVQLFPFFQQADQLRTRRQAANIPQDQNQAKRNKQKKVF